MKGLGENVGSVKKAWPQNYLDYKQGNHEIQQSSQDPWDPLPTTVGVCESSSVKVARSTPAITGVD